MIIPNGTVEFWRVQSAGGLDPNTGYPIAATGSWGNPIHCQFRHSTYNVQASSNGEPIIKKSFTIWIDIHNETPSERLRLKDKKGNSLGEFPVISFTPMEAVSQYEILV